MIDVLQTRLDRLLELAWEAGREVLRLELLPAHAEGLQAAAVYRGVRVEAALDRSRLVLAGPGDQVTSLGLP